MHCYEVIPEGAVCKLYFDLEFHKPSNKGSDGKTMVSSLIQVGCVFVSSFTIYPATVCPNTLLLSSLIHILMIMIQLLLSLSVRIPKSVLKKYPLFVFD